MPASHYVADICELHVIHLMLLPQPAQGKNRYLSDMTVQNVPILSTTESDLLLNQHSWTLEQYEAMITAGILGDGDKVELLFGKIVDMSPIGISHSYCSQELFRFMVKEFDDKYIIRSEQPVAFPMHSMPEPVFVLTKKLKHRFKNRRPGPEDILLIVEVSASTLGRDRGAKNKLYASYGLPEYWILNLIDGQLELYTEPTDTEGYLKREDFIPGEFFTSPLLGKLKVGAVMAWGEEE